ncbi:MAG: hypothetical protein ACRD4I_16030 [Candidatus Angelobacter sp.]
MAKMFDTAHDLGQPGVTDLAAAVEVGRGTEHLDTTIKKWQRNALVKRRIPATSLTQYSK